nr:unnamed protein product [Spirometra erinaceieuropaei]
MCATEDSQGRRLDYVPQMTPAVLHRGILLDGGSGDDDDWKRQVWSLVGGGGGAVGVDDCGEFASLERQAEAYQASIDALWQSGQPYHDVVPDGKGDRVPSLRLQATAPEEGIVGTNLLQLALFGELGFA